MIASTDASLSPEPPPKEIFVPETTFASRWRRLGAAVIDGFILGFLTGLVCIPFFDPLSRIGPWGRLLGFFIAVMYLGLMDSEKGNGQTLGKRLLRIQVINAEGYTPSVAKSFLRASILVIPFFLNSLPLPVSRTSSTVMALLGVCVFGLGGSTIYLMLFNKQTRQGLHDLAAGTYVINVSPHGAFAPGTIWRTHWAILGLLVGTLVFLSIFINTRLMKWGAFPELLQDATFIEALPQVQHAGIFDQHINSGSGETRHILMVNVFCTGRSNEEEEMANKVAAIILQNDPKAQNYDSIQVDVTRGYDLGIASSWRSSTFQHSPANWP